MLCLVALSVSSSAEPKIIENHYCVERDEAEVIISCLEREDDFKKISRTIQDSNCNCGFWASDLGYATVFILGLVSGGIVADRLGSR